MQHWYLFRCKAREDNRVEKLLGNQGYGTYFPKIFVNKSKSLKPKNILIPMFPGYLFIRLDVENTNWNAIRSTCGILDAVKFCHKLAIVHDKVIKQIRKQVFDIKDNYENRNELSCGDIVRISKGCFTGLTAIYQCRNGKDRIQILINLIGRLNDISINRKNMNVFLSETNIHNFYTCFNTDIQIRSVIKIYLSLSYIHLFKCLLTCGVLGSTIKRQLALIRLQN